MIHTHDIDTAFNHLRNEDPVILDREAARAFMTRLHTEPDLNLCLLTIEGTHAFGGENMGIDRVHMPQLSGVPEPGSPAARLPVHASGKVHLTKMFVRDLRAHGISVSATTHPDAFRLLATQDQISSAIVADGIAKRIQAGHPRDRSLVISADDHIVDGHHHWASEVALCLITGTEPTMPVHQVELPICDILRRAQKFANRMGIPSESVPA